MPAQLCKFSPIIFFFNVPGKSILVLPLWLSDYSPKHNPSHSYSDYQLSITHPHTKFLSPTSPSLHDSRHPKSHTTPGISLVASCKAVSLPHHSPEALTFIQKSVAQKNTSPLRNIINPSFLAFSTPFPFSNSPIPLQGSNLLPFGHPSFDSQKLKFHNSSALTNPKLNSRPNKGRRGDPRSLRTPWAQ